MKILCRCGNTLSDNTDAIPYKARFIADQDWFAFLDRIERAMKAGELNQEKVLHKLMDDAWKFHRCMYQCPECGRLYLDDINYDLQEFVPSKATVEKHLLKTNIKNQ